MRLKTHATGFPKGMSSEDEDTFISECKRRFGITIDCDKMSPNSAKKTLSKVNILRNITKSYCEILALP